ncbi:MAG: DUF362 domain-containing protein [candidate division Zixibacteria bacterium]
MADGRSRVVRIRSPLVNTDRGRIDSDILYQMLETGIEAFSGDEAPGFLGDLLKDSDTIGLKVNTLGGKGMSTRPELIDLFSALLKEAGIGEKKQIVWDRSDRELKSVGYNIKTRGGLRCFGTDHTGVGYSNDLVAKGGIGGLLSRILTEYCGGIINIPVLKDHGIAGITCSLKNHFGSIHNPNKYHDNGCDPYISDLNSMEQIRGKERLIIVDCLKVQYHGGPAYQPAWAFDYGGILVGTDPVAIDTIGYGIIEKLRKDNNKEPLKGSKREPIHIKRSAEYGLGTDNSEKIELVDLSI